MNWLRLVMAFIGATFVLAVVIAHVFFSGGINKNHKLQRDKALLIAAGIALITTAIAVG